MNRESKALTMCLIGWMLLTCIDVSKAFGTPPVENGTVTGIVSPADAKVKIVALTGGEDQQKVVAETKHDAKGCYSIDLPPGEYVIRFELEDAGRFWKGCRKKELRVIVKSGSTVTGVSCRLTLDGAAYVEGEIYVDFRKGTTEKQMRGVIEKYKCRELDRTEFSDSVSVVLQIPDDQSVEAMLKRITLDPNVESANPNNLTYWPSADFQR